MAKKLDPKEIVDGEGRRGSHLQLSIKSVSKKYRIQKSESRSQKKCGLQNGEITL